MRTTNRLKTANKRLAELLGWDLQSRHKTWVIDKFPGLTFTKRKAFATMVWVATAPEEMGGLGLDPLDIPFLIRYRVGYVPTKHRRYDYVPTLPKKINATEDAMFTRCFPRMTEEEYSEWEERWETS